MKDCCLCLLLFILIGFIIWVVKRHFDEDEKEKLENKQKYLQKLKIDKEIEDLKVEIEFTDDEKTKKLLQNEIEYLERKKDAL